jgi:hypothetical protein
VQRLAFGGDGPARLWLAAWVEVGCAREVGRGGALGHGEGGAVRWAMQEGARTRAWARKGAWRWVLGGLKEAFPFAFLHFLFLIFSIFLLFQIESFLNACFTNSLIKQNESMLQHDAHN